MTPSDEYSLENQLFAASESGDDSLVKLLLLGDADVDGSVDYRPLISASQRGHVRCVQILLEHGASVHILNRLGESALLVSSRNSSFEIVKLLLDGGALPTVEVCNNLRKALAVCHGFAELPELKELFRKLVDAMLPELLYFLVKFSQLAFEHGHLELARYLLTKDSDSTIMHHYTFALYFSAKNNWPQMVDDLLDKGVDVNSYWNGETALCAACKQGHAGIVEQLLRHGANSHIDRNLLPIQVACQRGDLDIVKKLFACSSSYATSSDAAELIRSYHPLHIAHDNFRQDVFNLLLNFGVSIDCADMSGTTVLHKAVRAGSVEQVKALIDLGASASFVNHAGESSLHLALRVNDETNSQPLNDVSEMLRLLISSGASCNTVDFNGETPLYRACSAGMEESVRILLEAGADINLTTSDRLPLMTACEAGNTRVVELLMKADGLLVNMRAAHNGQFTTPLCVAAMHHHHDTVDMLLKYGASPHSYDDHGLTALNCAIESATCIDEGSYETAPVVKVIESLLLSGADVNWSNYFGETPLYKACTLGCNDAVRLLLAHRANPNLVTVFGESPLLVACMKDNVCAAELLLASKAAVDILDEKTRSSSTPLHEAVRNGNYNLIIILLTNGLSVNVKNVNGETGLHLAPSVGVTKCLLENGAHVNVVATNNETPLYAACRRNLIDVVETLLKHGADPNIRSTKIPLFAACANNSVGLVRMLLGHGADPDLLPNANQLTGMKRKVVSFPSLDKELLYGKRFRRTSSGVEDDQVETDISGTNPLIANLNGSSLLNNMCTEGNLWIVNELLKHGANVNFVDCHGRNSLHCALDSRVSRRSKLSFEVCEYDRHVSLPLKGIDEEEASTSVLWRHKKFDQQQHSSSEERSAMASYSPAVSYQIAQLLIENGVDVNIMDITGRTALHRVIDIVCADELGSEIDSRFTDLLLNSGTCRVNTESFDGDSPLYVACRTRNVELVLRLLRQGARKSASWSLLVSCLCEDVDIVRLLLDEGVDPNPHPLSEFGCGLGNLSNAPLCVAASKGQVEIVQLLLRHGANANVVDCCGKTPLKYAVGNFSPPEGVHDHGAVLLTLIDYGINVNVSGITGDGTSLLCTAARNGWPLDLIRMLLNRGVNPNIPEANQHPLLIACLMNNEELVCLLLSFNADPNRPSRDDEALGSSVKLPLCSVVESGNKRIVDALIKYNANANKYDGAGLAALHYACRNNNLALVRILLTAGADPNLPTNTADDGRPFELPLCMAVRDGKKDIVNLLLCSQVNVNVQDGMGRTALHCGVKYTRKNPETCLNYGMKYTWRNPENLDLSNDSDEVEGSSSNSPDDDSNSDLSNDSDEVEGSSSDSSASTCIDDSDDDSNSGNHNERSDEASSLLMNTDEDVKASPSHSLASAHEDDAKNDLGSGMDLTILDHSPITECRTSVLNQLLDYGADLNIVDAKGQTPLYMAVRRELNDFVGRLLDRGGADPNRTTSGRYPLYLACRNVNMALVLKLLESGADPNVISGVDEYGLISTARIPLCIAAEMMNVSLMKTLIERGANVNQVDWNGNNAFSFLFEREYVDIDEELLSAAKLMLDHGADPNRLVSAHDVTPIECLLRQAFDDDSFKLIKMMIHAGVKLGDSDPNCESSTHFRLRECITSSSLLDNTMLPLFKMGTGRTYLSVGCESGQDIDYYDGPNDIDTRMCAAIVLDGYWASDADMRVLEQIDLTDEPPSAVKQFVDFLFWLGEDRKQAPSLLRQCRTTIRRQLLVVSGYRTIIPLADQLPLPVLLKRYVKFEGPISELDLTEPVRRSVSDEVD